MTTKTGRLDYKEPLERLTKYGYASCISNGNTVEGGLRSLTYKSIYALKLVDELNMAKNAIAPCGFEILLLAESKLSGDSVASLRSELEALKSRNGTRNTSVDAMVDSFNSQLDNELLEKKTITEEYQNTLLQKCGDTVSDSTVTFKKFISNEPVATMEEVEGFDGTMYHQAAERRREEERVENEKLALEAQKLEEEAMMEEMNFRNQEKVRLEVAQFQPQMPISKIASTNTVPPSETDLAMDIDSPSS